LTKGVRVSLNLSTVKVITLFTDDLEASTSFYRRVFGLAAIYEDDNSAVFQFENLMINLLESPAAHDLIAPATVAGAESGARFQFTIEVEHVDSACEELARRGVTLLNGPVDRPWGIRTASFVDPGGHIWEVADG
jgi:catechol 2,3-dioxygenase-like lactoylglutathione lyase family enzyme